jgi:hypothetical protein
VPPELTGSHCVRPIVWACSDERSLQGSGESTMHEVQSVRQSETERLMVS